jgi:phage tail-like protein
MAVERDQPYRNGNFRVDLGTGDSDSLRSQFSVVVLPEASIEAIEYRTGGDRSNEPHKLPGRIRYRDVVLRRGLIGSLDLYRWWSQVRDGDVVGARRTVTMQLLNEDHSEVVMTWRLVHAWPTKYASPTLDATGQDVAMEELVLAYERLEIE